LGVDHISNNFVSKDKKLDQFNFLQELTFSAFGPITKKNSVD